MSFVQSNSVTSGAQTSHQLAFPSAVTARSLLVAFVRSSATNDVVNSFSDNLNGAWTLLGAVTTSARRYRVYYTENSAAGAITVTGVTAANSTWRWAIAEFSGVALSSVIDASSFTSFTSTAAPTTPSVTTTQPNETLVGLLGLDNAVSTITSAGGETARFVQDLLIQGQDKSAGTAGSYTSAWTLDTAQAGAYAIVALKSPTASPAPNVGSVVMSGQVPVLVKQRTVLPAVGSVSIQGKVPVTTPGQLQPAQSALTLTGPAPTIIQQTGPNAGVGTAILVFNGLAPTLVLSRTIQPQLITSDAVTNGALAPTVLTQWTSKPGTAQLSLQGWTANLIKDGSVRVSPQPAQLTVAGLSVTSTVPFNGVLSPSRATLTTQGLVPDLIGNWIVAPAHDADIDILTITGLAPTLRGRLSWHDARPPRATSWRLS